MQPWSLRPSEPAELVCLVSERAVDFAWSGTVVAIIAAGVAWRTRDRAAAVDHHGLWALVMLLLGALQVLGAMFLVPSGCLSGHLFGRLLGAASPWVLAAGIFRAGVAPTAPLDLPPDDGNLRR